MARIAIHPSKHLAEELDALKMSAAELARRLKVPPYRVTAILPGPTAVTRARATQALPAVPPRGKLANGGADTGPRHTFGGKLGGKIQGWQAGWQAEIEGF